MLHRTGLTMYGEGTYTQEPYPQLPIVPVQEIKNGKVKKEALRISELPQGFSML